MSDYTERVRKNIHNKRLKEEISFELSSHIDEKIKDYTDMGCSPEEAARRAEADMGDEPERVAGLLESIHAYSRWGRILVNVIAGLIMLAAVIAEICYFIIFMLGPHELNGTVFCGCCYCLYIILLQYTAYINGEVCQGEGWLENRRTREKIDLFTQAVLYESNLDIEAENGYLLCIPLIGYLIEEQPSDDIDAYYSAEDAFIIPLPLEKPQYITLNIIDSRYEVKLY